MFFVFENARGGNGIFVQHFLLSHHVDGNVCIESSVNFDLPFFRTSGFSLHILPNCQNRHLKLADFARKNAFGAFFAVKN
jgi:hypothetical protein